MSARPLARRGRRATAFLAVAAVTTLAASPALANPGDPTLPGTTPNSEAGTIGITSATTVAKGQKISFAGAGFTGSPTGVFQAISAKIDAKGPTELYTGTAADGGVVGNYQVQADGTVSGSLIVPDDIDSPTVNAASAAGPHFLRFLGSAPIVSKWTQDFTVDPSAVAAPAVTATAAYAGRGGTLTITVTGTGFEANQAVAVARATGWNTADSLTTTAAVTTNAEGAFTATITPAAGTLTAGEHQLQVTAGASEGTAQLKIDARVAAAGLAQNHTGTLTVANVPVGTEISSVIVDRDGDLATTGDQSELLAAPAPITNSTSATVELKVPATQAIGYGQKVVVTQSKPYAKTYTATAKVSPDPEPFNADKFTRVETAAGAVSEGLYQSAYSTKSNAVFATAAFSGGEGWDGYLYKLDPNTLAVKAQARGPLVENPASGAPRYAPYGVGVDDVNGNVWVTNTRQNTVTVYDQATLAVKHVAAQGSVSHSRDVLYDKKTNRIFVTSASEGTNGNAAIAVFEADDNDNDGVKFEKIADVASELPRTEFSPMSLELDETTGTLYTTSLSTSKLMAIDTETLEYDLRDLDMDDLANRGASGIAFDAVSKRLFIVSQDNDLLLIANTDGSTIREIPIGAGALNVSFDPVNRLVYVANFGGTTISVVDVNGDAVANLQFSRPNHIHEDGKGSVYAVNKASGNQVIKLTPKKVVAPPKKLTAATPKLKGKAKVGKKLTVTLGTWTSGTKFTYTWLANGKVIKGAKAKTFKLTKKQKGKKIQVKVTGKKTGYVTVTKTSKKTATVKK